MFVDHGLEEPTFILYHKNYTFIGTVRGFGFCEGVLYMNHGDKNSNTQVVFLEDRATQKKSPTTGTISIYA